jgi:hypothetical protein
MKKEKAHIGGNAEERVPSRSLPESWPPPWLAKAREIAAANPLPPLPADPPELAAWDEIRVEETGGPCPTCGSLERWQDPLGVWRCQQCEPIRRALALADLAARIRSRKR